MRLGDMNISVCKLCRKNTPRCLCEIQHRRPAKKRKGRRLQIFIMKASLLIRSFRMREKTCPFFVSLLLLSE